MSTIRTLPSPLFLMGLVSFVALLGCEGVLESTYYEERIARDAGLPPLDGGMAQAGDDGTQDMSGGMPDEGIDELDAHVDASMGMEGERCLTTPRFVARKLLPNVLEPSCRMCHHERGVAATTDFVLEPPGARPDHIERTVDQLTRLANLRSSQHGDLSLLLLKPSGVVDHGGGEIFSTSSEEYAVLEEFVRRVSEQDPCAQVDDADFFVGVSLHSPESLWRKTALALGDRLPTAEERSAIEAQGEGALEGLLEGLLDEPAFYERLKEGYNDILLTDGHLNNQGNEPMGDLSTAHYPDRYWFDGAGDSDAVREGRRATRWGLGRGPLELVAHVVREGRPFTEVLTADYMMVNFAAAKSLGVEDRASFAGQEDIEEFVEVRLPPTPEAPYASDAFPHAGLLTDYMYWRRYRSAATNRNRARAATVYDHFLATDAYKLAPLGGDPAAVRDFFNPVLDAAQCNTCHDAVDPMAGSLQNFNRSGQWDPRDDGWYADSFSAGFEDALLPASEVYVAERWLGKQIIADPRFAEAVVGHVWLILFGRAPLSMPRDVDAANFSARMRAYEVQRAYLGEVHEAFITSNYDLKLVFKRLLLSPFYRAKSARADVNESHRAALYDVGTSKLLSPPELHRRIETLLGYAWDISGSNAVERRGDVLKRILNYEIPNSGREYFFLYGGLDAETINERLDGPNAMMAGLMRYMAHDVSCKAVSLDFARSAMARMLFPHASLDDLPGSSVEADARIAQNVTYLLDRLLGIQAEAGDADFDLFLALFQEVQAAGKARVDAEEERATLGSRCAIPSKPDDDRYDTLGEVTADPLYVIRAWRAVVSAMLQSKEFLYDM